MKPVEAVFDGEVLRLVKPVRLKANTRVLVQLEELDAAALNPTDQPKELSAAMSPTPSRAHQVTTTLPIRTTTSYVVIANDADLLKHAVNYWPKNEPVSSTQSVEAADTDGMKIDTQAAKAKPEGQAADDSIGAVNPRAETSSPDPAQARVKSPAVSSKVPKVVDEFDVADDVDLLVMDDFVDHVPGA